MLESQLFTLGRLASLPLDLLRLVLSLDLYVAEEFHHLVLEVFQQLFKQLEGLALVLLLGVLLGVGAQVNTLAQMIHGGQVLLPQGIEHLQHDLFFDLAHARADPLALGIVRCLDFATDLFPQGLLMQLIVGLQPLRQRQGNGEFRLQLFFQARDIPLFLHAQGWDEAVYHIVDDVAANSGNGVRDIVLAQQVVALLVDDLALVIGHIVILQQLLANIEVAPFHLALRLLDGIGHHAVLDRLALLHTESLHEALDPVRRENAHEVVFQRQVEPGKTGVALPTRAAAQLVVDTARFVALGTEDMQPAGIQYLLVTLLPGRLEFHPPGIVDRARGCKLCLKVTAKYDVCAPAGHIGGDSDHPRPPGLGDDLRLLLVIFGVQHLVRDIGLAEALGQLFRGFHRGGTHQHRRALGHTILDVRHDGVEFLFLAQVHKVVEVFALLGHVGGNHQYLQAVNLAKFKGLGVGGAGHAGQLAIKAEIVLEGRGCQGLALTLDGYTLFCLNRLVQALGQAPPRHGPPGVLVDQHHLPVLHDVLDIAVEHDVRPQAGVHVVQQVEISGRVQALALRQQLLADHQGLNVLMPLFRQLHVALLFIDSKVTGLPLHVGLQQGDHTVDALVQLGTVLRRPGDNQRGAGLVDQDGIDLIHDGEAQRSLHPVFQRKRHVIAQVIEAEFVVGAIDNIGAVGLTLLTL